MTHNFLHFYHDLMNQTRGAYKYVYIQVYVFTIYFSLEKKFEDMTHVTGYKLGTLRELTCLDIVSYYGLELKAQLLTCNVVVQGLKR